MAKAKERAKAKEAAKAKPDDNPRYSDDVSEDSKIVGDMVRKRVTEHKGELSAREFQDKDFREHRETLRQKYPGMKLGDLMKTFEAGSLNGVETR